MYCSWCDAQVFADVFRQRIVYFAMARNGLFLARVRIQVNVVPPTMPQQQAPGSQRLPDQFIALHTAISLIV
jgi:hypothetical protein